MRGTPPCWDGISSTSLTATEIFIQAAARPALMMCLCADWASGGGREGREGVGVPGCRAAMPGE